TQEAQPVGFGTSGHKVAETFHSLMQSLSGIGVELRGVTGVERCAELRAKDVKDERREELLRVGANRRSVLDRGLVALIRIAVDDPEDICVIVAQCLAGE